MSEAYPIILLCIDIFLKKEGKKERENREISFQSQIHSPAGHFFSLSVIISERVCSRRVWMQTTFSNISSSLKKFLRSKRIALKMCHNEKSLPSLSNERNTLFFFFPSNDGDGTRIMEPRDSLHRGKDFCLQPLAIISPETHFKAVIQSKRDFWMKFSKIKGETAVCGELRLVGEGTVFEETIQTKHRFDSAVTVRQCSPQ